MLSLLKRVNFLTTVNTTKLFWSYEHDDEVIFRTGKLLDSTKLENFFSQNLNKIIKFWVNVALSISRMGTICFAFQFMFCFLSGCLLFRQARWQAGDDRKQEVV